MLAEYADVRFDGPPRAYNATSYAKRYIAIHNTSNDATDTGEADYGQARTDGTSSHYYVDADSITQSLRTEYGANHAGSTTGNRYAISYEITGTNGKSRAWWLDNVAWAVLARQIARDCRKWSIPAVLLTTAQMKDGTTKGIVTHDLMRQAWGGTTHTDPGANFPLDHLLALVRAELDGDIMDGFNANDRADVIALASRVLGTLMLDPTLINKRVIEAGKLPNAPLIDAIKRIDQQGKDNGLAGVAILARLSAIDELIGEVRDQLPAVNIPDEQLERVLRKMFATFAEPAPVG